MDDYRSSKRQSSSQIPPTPQHLTVDDVDRLLSSSFVSHRASVTAYTALTLSSKKIINRSRRACYPCSRRKIKCDRDYKQPCSGCIKHSHPELCSWTKENDDASLKQVAGSRRTYDEYTEDHQLQTRPQAVYSFHNDQRPFHTASNPADTRPLKLPRPDREPTLDNVVHNYRDPNNQGISANPRAPSAPTEIPNRSVASLVQDRASDTHLVGVSSMLGIENRTASYLFIKASGPQERWRQLNSMLPPEKEVLKYFGFFKSLALPFTAGLIDPEEFEFSVCRYVEDLAQGNTARFENETSIAWTGLMLAVLSGGVQLSDLPFDERTKMSRDYARKSFHCLRLANFLLRPSEEIIQTLLLLVLVLQNDRQAFSAWSMMGTILRLTQSLGLDIRQLKEDERALLVPRYRKLWRAVLWSDAVLSICLGRPPSAHYRLSIAQPPWDEQNLSYFDSMFCLSDIVMTIIDPLRPEDRTNAQALSDVQRVEAIFSTAALHLQSKDRCRNLKDRTEHYALQLHISFAVSYICQMALRKGDEGVNATELTEKLKESLAVSVRAFLNLTSISIVPLRGWTYVHHALSSALLLGLMGETKSNPEVRSLQESLISVLSAADGDSEPSIGESSSADGPTRFTNRHAKALEALQAMCNHASKVESPSPNFHAAAENGDSATQIPPGAAAPYDPTQTANGQWYFHDVDAIRSPNGTIISPGTFWDSLFADSTIAADLGWSTALPHQDTTSWGM